jgi:prevent-host-death family protein
MKSIGVRELRQRASEYLKQIEAGGTLQVTANGRPVALLVPVRRRRQGRRQTLTDQGRLVPGAGDLLDLGPPLPPSPKVHLPSAALAKARTNER